MFLLTYKPTHFTFLLTYRPTHFMFLLTYRPTHFMFLLTCKPTHFTFLLTYKPTHFTFLLTYKPTHLPCLSAQQDRHRHAFLSVGRGPCDGVAERDWPQHVRGRLQAMGAQWRAAAEGHCARPGEGQLSCHNAQCLFSCLLYWSYYDFCFLLTFLMPVCFRVS